MLLVERVCFFGISNKNNLKQHVYVGEEIVDEQVEIADGGNGMNDNLPTMIQQPSEVIGGKDLLSKKGTATVSFNEHDMREENGLQFQDLQSMHNYLKTKGN